MTKTAQVSYPDLTIGEDATPRSQVFEDIYFSRDGGIAETQHVFLKGNVLPERWCSKDTFTIAELGFGTGLNFLVTWQTFNESAQGRLHYVAIEKFPLTSGMLTQTLALQPELGELSAQLIAQYPARLPGWHRLVFENVTLTLGFGDIAELLPDITMPVDAWYLDGFAPAKNAAMWSDAVLTLIAQKSAADATFATFTAAVAVRRGLEARGFTVSKVPGYGKKREMSIGSLKNSRTYPSSLRARSEAVHLSPVKEDGLPRPPRGLAMTREKSASHLIIGGGIAGCSTARALAERGIKVQLLTKAVADGASGNAVAVLFPQLSKQWLSSTHWFFAGMDFTQRRVQQWQQQVQQTLMGAPGLLRLPRHAEEAAALQNINTKLGLDTSIVEWSDAAEASALAGVKLATGAAWVKQGSWVAAAALCRVLLDHPNITTREKVEVQALVREENHWYATLSDGEMLQAETVIVANAHAANTLLPVKLPLGITSGQVSLFDAKNAAAIPQVILCHKGYLVARDDTVLIGATYDREDLSCTVTAQNHTKNKAEIDHFLPGFAQADATSGRTSLRATTPDRMPYVGKLAPGLWVSLGHGSRGFCSAPLAGEIIASELCGEMLPVDPTLRRAVDLHRVIK